MASQPEYMRSYGRGGRTVLDYAAPSLAAKVAMVISMP